MRIQNTYSWLEHEQIIILTPTHTLGPVSAWMGDRLRASKLSQYVTSHPGQLSLAIRLWVGAMSTSLGWKGNLASHWPCITDNSGLSTYGLNGLWQADEHPAYAPSEYGPPLPFNTHLTSSSWIHAYIAIQPICIQLLQDVPNNWWSWSIRKWNGKKMTMLTGTTEMFLTLESVQTSATMTNGHFLDSSLKNIQL